MSDRRLDEALRSLPTARASDEFTAQVLRRLPADAGTEQGPGNPWNRPASWAGLAAAAMLLLAFAGVLLAPRGGGDDSAAVDREEARALLEELRQDHRRLTAEVRSLREHQQAPVLYLGGDEGLDIVLDLGREDLRPSARRAPAGGEYRPARMTTY
ncbi:MAG: hypothetical protein AAF604_03070 [Acidobacteriota bacterium]